MPSSQGNGTVDGSLGGLEQERRRGRGGAASDRRQSSVRAGEDSHENFTGGGGNWSKQREFMRVWVRESKKD